MSWKALTLVRPHHWVKNLVVLLPLFTSLHAGSLWAWGRAGIAMAAFCLVASAVYVLNDLCDARADRLHPAKKDRPLASGAVGVGAAATVGMIFLVGGWSLAAVAGPRVMLTVVVYWILQAAYSLYLKHRMIADVICIALGFVLRAVAGAVAIQVDVSPWLFTCTFTLCLFMGFCKRSNELATLGEEKAPGDPSTTLAAGRSTSLAAGHRRTLAGYTPELLTHLITLSAAVAVIAFLTYATNAETVSRFHTNYLVYTLPLFLYGVCRFAMLSMSGAYSDPVDLLLRDWPFLATVVLWFAAAGLVLLYGQWYGPPQGP